MYYQHFGLSGPPFQFTPSPRLLYLSRAHREGLAALEWGLKEPSGFTSLIGEAGTGKTTLICSLLAREHRWVRIAYVSNPKLSFEELLKVILDQLPVRIAEPGKLGLIQALNELLSRLNEQERVAIIIDEAQDLSDEVLEELRLLSNFERYERKLLQIILVGQPELERRLSQPHLRQLNQRIGARARLEPLDQREIREYIEYRLNANNGSLEKIFSPAALRLIARESNGIPRQINLLCHNAMLVAYASGSKQVDIKAARRALKECAQALTGKKQTTNMADAWARIVGASKPRLRLAAALSGLALLGGLTTYYWQKLQADAALVKPSHSEAQERRPFVLENVKANPAYATPALREDRLEVTPIIMPSEPSATRSGSLPTREVTTYIVKDGDGNAPAADRTTEEKRKVVVRRGDTLANIAARYLGSKDELDRLVKANPQIKDPNRLYPGDTIYLPAPFSTSSRE